MTARVSPEPASLEGAGNGTSRTYRVRFDEAGARGTARTSALLRYAQDIGWLHSDELGFDREWYRTRRLAWLVRAAELEVCAPIPMGRPLELATAIVGHGRAWARRRVEMRRPDGTLAAWVHTDWVMVDGRGSVTRIPEAFGVAFPNPPATFPITRATLPEMPPDAHRTSIVVRRHEVDPFAHVNNAAYLDWFEEAVAVSGSSTGTDESGLLDEVPRRYRLEFLSAVTLGAVLEARTWRHESGQWAHRLVDADGRDAFRAVLEP